MRSVSFDGDGNEMASPPKRGVRGGLSAGRAGVLMGGGQASSTLGGFDEVYIRATLLWEGNGFGFPKGKGGLMKLKKKKRSFSSRGSQ